MMDVKILSKQVQIFLRGCEGKLLLSRPKDAVGIGLCIIIGLILNSLLSDLVHLSDPQAANQVVGCNCSNESGPRLFALHFMPTWQSGKTSNPANGRGYPALGKACPPPQTKITGIGQAGTMTEARSLTHVVPIPPRHEPPRRSPLPFGLFQSRRAERCIHSLPHPHTRHPVYGISRPGRQY